MGQKYDVGRLRLMALTYRAFDNFINMKSSLKSTQRNRVKRKRKKK